MIGETAQLILDRMKSKPEDFFRSGHNRWHWLFDDGIRGLLTEEEREVLQAEYEEVRKKEFHHKVLETILEGDREAPTYTDEAYRSSRTIGGNRITMDTLNRYTFTQPSVAPGLQIGETTITEADLKVLLTNAKAAVEAEAKEQA